MITPHDCNVIESLLSGPDEQTTYESFPYNPGLPENNKMRRKQKNREKQRNRQDAEQQEESQEKWNWSSNGKTRLKVSLNLLVNPCRSNIEVFSFGDVCVLVSYH